MLSCKEITRLVSESLDQELPLQQRLAVQAHFRICELCLRYQKQLLFIRDTIRRYSTKIEEAESFPGSLRQAQDTASLSQKARERIKRQMREQTQNIEGETDPPPNRTQTDS